ncbi:hypothetical protein AVEN_228053-2 [Araneus ventricosus]|uniref:TIL domain-containing protein n=1 Tax=Araneus ventricosus TaxID=182803 RepID=A0A4Y2MDS7_ARAVE|nr:hypothetical protein AVEN_228053-2 [Araneus ventricosus]
MFILGPRAQDVDSALVQNTGAAADLSLAQSTGPAPQDSDSSLDEYTGQPQCSVNEVYKYCGGCDQYCNKPPVSCTADCRPGCYCRVGFKRSFLGGICIPNSICPVIQDSDSSMVENTGPLAHDVDSSFVENSACGENEVFNQCGVGKECEDYCGRGPNACAYCRPGCYCKRGYIRSGPESNAKCIRKNRCPHVLDASPSFAQGPGYDCRPDEVFDICGVGPECENYCGRGANACAYCQAGCYCKQGTIRAGASNRTRCIPENKCPVAQKCFKNEVYSDCGTACPANCDNKNPVCTLECVADCFCKEGFIRMHADVQAKRYECIPQDQCPP